VQVGTPHFMSPELLSEKGYSYGTDVWCVNMAHDTRHTHTHTQFLSWPYIPNFGARGGSHLFCAVTPRATQRQLLLLYGKAP
jgi:serine/threonine protein kinase